MIIITIIIIYDNSIFIIKLLLIIYNNSNDNDIKYVEIVLDIPLATNTEDTYKNNN